MKLKDHLNKALQDPAFRKEYERFDLFFELGQLWLQFKLWFYNKFSK